jgi:ribosomal-protein-alanine N-acetyltransferase
MAARAEDGRVIGNPVETAVETVVDIPAGGRRGVDVLLTPMRRRHLRSVLRIESQAGHRGWSLGLFMSELAIPTGRRYLVAKVDGQVVGFAGMLFIGSDGHVTTIAVHPDWRRHQVGSRLMLALTAEARERGMTAITLEVRAGNEPAQAMYHRFGYAPAGIRRDYYRETGEDALVMWAHDIDSPAYQHRLAAIETDLSGRTSFEGLTARTTLSSVPPPPDPPHPDVRGDQP